MCHLCKHDPCVCGYAYRGYSLENRLFLARAIMGPAYADPFTRFEQICRGIESAKVKRRRDPNAPLEAFQKHLDAEVRFYETTAAGLCYPDGFIGVKTDNTAPGALPTMDQQEAEHE